MKIGFYCILLRHLRYMKKKQKKKKKKKIKQFRITSLKRFSMLSKYFSINSQTFGLSDSFSYSSFVPLICLQNIELPNDEKIFKISIKYSDRDFKMSSDQTKKHITSICSWSFRGGFRTQIESTKKNFLKV